MKDSEKKTMKNEKNEEYVEACGGIPTVELPNDITELVFILDKSGSMSGMEKDTVGGFNSMIERQKAESGKAFVTTVLFSSRMEIIHDRIPIEKVKPITEAQYRVGGSTALYDAIGRTVEHIDTIHRYIRPKDVPARTIFVITTDGEENASREFTLAKIKEMIESHKREREWTFMFLAANIDAFATAEGLGIGRGNAASYSVERETGAMYCRVSNAVASFRTRGCIDEDWAGDLGEDSKKGPKKK